MKKMISILLSVVLVMGTCCVTVGAVSDKDKIYLQCFNNDDLKCTVLIMTFDKSFTEIGNKPQVEINTENGSVTVEQDKILQEIHKGGAQLFICLPTYLSDEKEDAIPTSSVLTVSEGAFYAEEELSPSYSGVLCVSDSVTRSTKDWELIKDISGAKAKVLVSYIYEDTSFPIGSHPKGRDIIVAGTEMLLSSVNWAWQADEITFTEAGEQADLSVSASVCGEHTVIGKVNDFVYDSFSFTVVSKEQAKKDSLWIYFKQTLRSVYVIPIGLLLGLTMPGMFMIAGQFMMIERFFKQLFSKELVEEYNTIMIR